jgi:hypothetical protein
MATTEQRLAEYEDLFKKAQSYDMNKYQQDFQKAYNEAMNYNQDLIQQKASSLGELQAVAPTMRERYSSSLITDPTRQMSLIAQARQAPITDWGQAVDLLSARGAKYSDILGKALGGYQTAAEQANTAAENAWRLYQDAVQQDQFRRSQGGGGGPSDLLKYLTGGGEQETVIDTGEDDKKPISWTQKVLNTLDKNSLLGGTDVTTLRPKSTKEAIALGLKAAINPISIPKTIGGMVGNLIGNRNNQDMNFWQRLINLR